MICIILETLVVKGLFTAGHWLAAHGTSALAAKGSSMLVHSIATHGFLNTASAVAGGAITTGLVVGGVTWTSGLIKLLGEALEALSRGETMSAMKKFSKLYNELHGVDIEFFPDVVEKMLPKIGFSIADAKSIGDFLRSSEESILDFAKLG